MHVDKTVENARECMCLTCPSYTKTCKIKNVPELTEEVAHIDDVQHLEMMFCAFEKSNCIHEHRGCLCPECPVHQKYALNNEDYCLNSGGIL